jgi:hypothetical protein
MIVDLSTTFSSEDSILGKILANEGVEPSLANEREVLVPKLIEENDNLICDKMLPNKGESNRNIFKSFLKVDLLLYR